LKKRKASQVITSWNISGKKIPVKIYFEWRSSRRVSIGKSSIIVRLPWVEKNTYSLVHEDWAKKWLEKQYAKKPLSFQHLFSLEYNSGDVIHTTRKSYTVGITKEKRKSGTAKCQPNHIFFKIPDDLDYMSESKMIHSLLGRVLAQDNISWVDQRIRWLNQHYIQKPLKTVRLKNNTSNWGSCSSSGNINISVRLLFAPEEVQDYVMIHELAHLREMNHNDRFWRIVEGIMPDYRKKERWLKNYSHLCNF